MAETFRATDFLKTKKSCASIFRAQNSTNVTNPIQIRGDWDYINVP